MPADDNDAKKQAVATDAETRARVGKNLLIEIPEWHDPATRQGRREYFPADCPQVSYLRLGKFAKADMTEKGRGADLVDKVDKIGPGEGWDVSSAHPRHDPGYRRPRMFEDDERKRLGAPGHSPDRARSESVTQREYPSSGWRDHTEGDRVTTTRGDKIEVIGGNYKLVVLGRHATADQAAGLDLSGGVLQTFDATPTTVNEVRWVKSRYDGTWKTFEKTRKGDVHSYYHGDVFEEFCGEYLTRVIGDWDHRPPHWAPDEANGDRMASTPDIPRRPDPVIVEKTSARSISRETGHPAHPPEFIHEDVRADKITRKVLATATRGPGDFTRTEESTGNYADTRIAALDLHRTTRATGSFVESITARKHTLVYEAQESEVLCRGGKRSEEFAGEHTTMNLRDRKDTRLGKVSETINQRQTVSQKEDTTVGEHSLKVGTQKIQALEQQVSAGKRQTRAQSEVLQAVDVKTTAGSFAVTSAVIKLGI